MKQKCPSLRFWPSAPSLQLLASRCHMKSIACKAAIEAIDFFQTATKSKNHITIQNCHVHDYSSSCREALMRCADIHLEAKFWLFHELQGQTSDYCRSIYVVVGLLYLLSLQPARRETHTSCDLWEVNNRTPLTWGVPSNSMPAMAWREFRNARLSHICLQEARWGCFLSFWWWN